MATLHKLLQTGCRYFRTINSPTVKYYQASCAYSTGSGSKKKRIVQENDPEAYDQAFEEARDRPEEFWGRAAEGIVWHKKWNKVLDNSKSPFSQW